MRNSRRCPDSDSIHTERRRTKSKIAFHSSFIRLMNCLFCCTRLTQAWIIVRKRALRGAEKAPCNVTQKNTKILMNCICVELTNKMPFSFVCKFFWVIFPSNLIGWTDCGCLWPSNDWRLSRSKCQPHAINLIKFECRPVCSSNFRIQEMICIFTKIPFLFIVSGELQFRNWVTWANEVNAGVHPISE